MTAQWLQQWLCVGADLLAAECAAALAGKQTTLTGTIQPSYVLLAFDGTWPQAREMFRV